MLELVVIACLAADPASCKMIPIARFEGQRSCDVLAAPLVAQVDGSINLGCGGIFWD